VTYGLGMADLAADSELHQVGPSTYERVLSLDWELWGPNGGYVAAVALRAAQHHSGRARPANASVHFLGVASFHAPVSVTARTQRATRQATSVAVDVVQGDKPVLAAMVWAIDDGLDGLEHDDAPPPDVPSWRECPTVEERLAAEGLPLDRLYRFWENFEGRPASWTGDWANRTASRPLYQNWLRFIDGGPTTDPWLQAARLLLLVDLGGWPAVGRRHLDESWMAPSIDVACEFHRPGTGDEWFLLQGESPHAGDGLVASHQHVWNDRGELLASGVSHLICRKRP
jgi:acyl-CoA thioesterase